ncbi:MAG TPA: hypothetical protein VF792_10590 [Ktedonobacterales bacterium]
MLSFVRRWSALVMALLVGVLVVGCTPMEGQAAAHRTATPAPTFPPSVAGGLAARVQRSVGGLAQKVDVAYDAQKQTANVTLTVTGLVPNTDARVAAAYALVRTLTFKAMRALWSSDVGLREVTLIVLGPIQDEYDEIINDWYGVVVVEATTAQRIAWTSMSADTAWSMYDQNNLRYRFELFD